MFGIRNGVVNHGGLAADLRPWGADRGMVSRLAERSFAGVLLAAGYHTASISSFPLRHSATWWTGGFLESMNLMRGRGWERADQVLPFALDWLDRRGTEDAWFLHVHFWDPHTPYLTPDSYGNPFAGMPAPRLAHRGGPGPELGAGRSPLGPGALGLRTRPVGRPAPRHPWDLATMEDVVKMFDGYDVGVRFADDAVAALLTKLDQLGVLEDTAVWIGSDHGEAFGELGVYADHQAADAATAHIPAVLAWPGIDPQVQDGAALPPGRGAPPWPTWPVAASPATGTACRRGRRWRQPRRPPAARRWW